MGIENCISVLLEEYKMMQGKVVRNLNTFDKLVLQIVIVFGAVLFFSITNFQNNVNLYYRIFVDISCLFISLGILFYLVCIGIIYQIKILYLGEELILLEIKINTLLNLLISDSNYKLYKSNMFFLKEFGYDESDFVFLNWETWRRKHGYANRSIVNCDGFLLYISIAFVTILMISFRLYFLILNKVNVLLYVFILVIFAIIAFHVLRKLKLIIKEENYRINEIISKQCG